MSIDYQKVDDLDEATLKNTLVDLDISVGGNNVGTITLEFWPEAAPITVRNFVRYAAEGFYAGKTFHRVMPDFMIQGGCPQGTGTGSGPHGTIRGEFHSDRQYTHARGVISMARAQDPNSASCQFFICTVAADFLDGQYASFGAMTKGEETLNAVAGVSRKMGMGGEQSSPNEECRIDAVRVYARD